MKRILWILLAGLLSLNVIEAQETPLNSVKTERGANDPMAHQYLSKTRKWMNASKALEAYFMVCMGQDERSAFLNCQPGSILLSGEKYRLLMGGEEYYCDAKNIWTYSQSTQEASVYPYDKSQSDLNPFLLIRNYEKYYRAKYIRQESIEGSMRNIIDLIPLEASEFLKIRIFLNESDNRIFRISMYLPQSQLYIYSVTKYIDEPQINENTFVFDQSKHPDVMLIDMR